MACRASAPVPKEWRGPMPAASPTRDALACSGARPEGCDSPPQSSLQDRNLALEAGSARLPRLAELWLAQHARGPTLEEGSEANVQHSAPYLSLLFISSRCSAAAPTSYLLPRDDDSRRAHPSTRGRSEGPPAVFLRGTLPVYLSNPPHYRGSKARAATLLHHDVRVSRLWQPADGKSGRPVQDRYPASTSRGS